jgi:hypothetical protein
MGAVCRASLNRFISEENQESYDLWLHHTKTNPALGRELLDIMLQFAEKLFGSYKNWEDKYFKLRYLQYEWVRFTLGNARSNLWFNSGILYWMLNDCWPAAMGWSLLDYYNKPKASYYAVKTGAQPTTTHIEKAENGYQVHVSNILEQKNTTDISLKAYLLNLDTGGSQPLSELLLESNTVHKNVQLDVVLKDNEILIADVQSGTGFMRSWYKEGLPILEKTEGIFFDVKQEGIEVWAENYVHVVEIEGVDYLSDNYFSLLPGEKRFVYWDKEPESQNFSVLGYTFTKALHGTCVL